MNDRRAPLMGMAATLRGLPGGVWALGFVSLLMDTSSELIHSLLPVFLVSVLGTSTLTVGLIEGVAEAMTLVTKVFSGILSDAVGRRKPLVLLGYGLAAFTKPLFPLAGSVAAVMTARFTDRVGKGIREAPRDALLADITPPRLSGASYGLRQALDTVGAVAGPLLAVLGVELFAGDLRKTFWVASLPAFAAVLWLAVGVREQPAASVPGQVRRSIHAVHLSGLSRTYWSLVALGAVFTFARFTEAFLVLRAKSVGMPLVEIPLIMVVMNVSYALSAFPSGYHGDKVDRRYLLAAGLAMLMMADLILANAHAAAAAYVGAVFWGLHLGLTQGIFSAMVADAAPERLRGSAFGVFNLVSGGALLLASVTAGGVWELLGPAATFYMGAGVSVLALAGLGVVKVRPVE